MSGSWPTHSLPKLSSKNHKITSPATRQYNCIAWAAGDNKKKWWPDPLGIGYWPPGLQRGSTLNDFLNAYSQLGYRPCRDGSLEKGIEKISIFATDGMAGPSPQYAAIQLENGHWSSKLGDFEDIAHATVHDVECSTYGRVVAFMARPRRP